MNWFDWVLWGTGALVWAVAIIVGVAYGSGRVTVSRMTQEEFDARYGKDHE